MHVISREWSVEENDDDGMLQVKWDEQKVAVVGYKSTLFQKSPPPLTPVVEKKKKKKVTKVSSMIDS